MLERPEALVLARQLNETLGGHRIKKVAVATHPHKMAWLNEDHRSYSEILTGDFLGAEAFGGQVELTFEGGQLLVADGVSSRYWESMAALDGAKIKHQVLIGFDHGPCLSFGVQMYGGIWAYRPGDHDNPYYLVAKAKPGIESKAFTYAYFRDLALGGAGKLSAKAFLATEQRIPGLGNGVLQDLLFEARLHPKRKVATFSDGDWERLFEVLKTLVPEVAAKGGRDTEVDLFGRPGGYQTKMSKANQSKRCPQCGEMIVKEAYMGGSVYYCALCQIMG